MDAISAAAPPPLSARKRALREFADRAATARDHWIAKNPYYHAEDWRYMRFLVPEGLKVLDLGCGTGDLLAALKPSLGVGVDLSPRMVAVAATKYPGLDFRVGDVEDPEFLATLPGPFDVIVLSDTIGSLDDCEATLAHLHLVATRETRLIVAYYSRMWEPIVRLAERLGLKMPTVAQNWLWTDDIAALLELADFQPIRREWRQLLPLRLFGLGPLVNRYLGTLPILRRASLRNYLVARPMRNITLGQPSATVVVPARNEQGNIEPLVRRLPRFCPDLEIVFVEGHSRDGTRGEIERVIAAHADRDIKLVVQEGVGKANAVHAGFDRARGAVLIILDADMSVPPEAVPKFYQALVSGRGNFINGTRLVYPMERQAMRFLNLLANHFFSLLFTWLLNQRFTDTLCGTKALTKAHYDAIARNRHFFGDFDPFGDFDLIFGATKLHLKVVEIPIRYAERSYGETQIDRFRHGALLFRMVAFAYLKLKAF
ncbi:MAG: glycosyltransferase [Alphaproteobacteria bacterium]|nr:glycosyltransferase [Alphaproteobacteria bacterium]